MTKQNPTRRQSAAIARQREHGHGIRAWLQRQAAAASDQKARMRKRAPHPSERPGPDDAKVLRLPPGPPHAERAGVDSRTYVGNHATRRAAGWRTTVRPPRRRELAARAVARLDDAESQTLATEVAKRRKAGLPPLTRVEISARCWELIGARKGGRP